MTKDELGKMIDNPDFASEIRCYGEDKFRNIIKEIYFAGMREGYNLAKFRLELLDRMPFGAADDFLDKNLEEIRKVLKLCERYESAPDE